MGKTGGVVDLVNSEYSETVSTTQKKGIFGLCSFPKFLKEKKGVAVTIIKMIARAPAREMQ